MTALFYIAGTVALLGSAMTVTRTRAMHALLNLVVTLLAIALVFLSLGAPMLAALEVIVYAGAIVVLFLFALMFLNLGPGARDRERRWLTPAAWIVPCTLTAALLVATLWAIAAGAPSPSTAGEEIGPAQFGEALFTDYVLGVEIASVLLLAALVGAYAISARGRPDRTSGDREVAGGAP